MMESQVTLSAARPWPWREMTARIGPIHFRLRTPLGRVWQELAWLYRDYPRDDPSLCPEYEVTVRPTAWWRRWVRPQIKLQADVSGPFAPLPADLGMVAFEMGMNYQVAVGLNRYLLFHASVVARDGECLIFSAESGSGKSTLAAGLAYDGWRLFGDEFAMINPATGLAVPFPRPISLKNQSIDLMTGRVPAGRLSRRYEGTPKGTLAYLIPPPDAIRRMDEPARPRAVVFPQFRRGGEPQLVRISTAEAHIRLVASSTNYEMLGEAGFRVLANMLHTCPAYRIEYASLDEAVELVEVIWREGARQPADMHG